MAQEKQFHIGVKALVKNGQGQVLLMHEDPAAHNVPIDDYWDLPGGRMQVGETALQTLAREVEEETGITDVRSPRFLTAVISNHEIKLTDDLTVGLLLMVYEAQVPPEAKIRLSDEHLGYEWVSAAEAKERLANKYPPEFTDSLQ